MTANKLEGKARELLAEEMREHYPTTADRLLMPSFDGTLPYSTEAAIRAIVRALDTARQSEGMVLVPREPTREMEEAGCQGYMAADGGAWLMHKSSMGFAYRAMLAAAPADAGEG